VLFLRYRCELTKIEWIWVDDERCHVTYSWRKRCGHRQQLATRRSKRTQEINWDNVVDAAALLTHVFISVHSSLAVKWHHIQCNQHTIEYGQLLVGLHDRQCDNDNRTIGTNGAATLSRMNFSGYVGHATMFSW